jgi:hypothetical protein
VEAEFFRADEQTEGWTDMTKLAVAFHDGVKELKANFQM